MLIQNVSNSVQTAPPGGRISTEAPKVFVDTQSNDTVQHVSPEQLSVAVQGLNQALQQSHKSLQFSVDNNTKTPVVSLTDSETGQVILQFPSKAALSISQSITEFQQRQGLLFNQKA